MGNQTATPHRRNGEASRGPAGNLAGYNTLPDYAPGRYVQQPHDHRRAVESVRGGAAWLVAARISALCHGVDGRGWWDSGVPVDAASWGAETGYHRTTIVRALRAAEAAGAIERVTEGRWRTVVPPVDYVDTTRMCASTHAPVSIYKQTDVCNSKQATTKESVETTDKPPKNEPQIEQIPRHYIARRWYTWDRLAPVGSGRRRVSLPHVARYYAEKIAGPAWFAGGACSLGALAEIVAKKIADDARFSSSYARPWTVGALTFALRCAAEDCRSEQNNSPNETRENTENVDTSTDGIKLIRWRRENQPIYASDTRFLFAKPRTVRKSKQAQCWVTGRGQFPAVTSEGNDGPVAGLPRNIVVGDSSLCRRRDETGPERATTETAPQTGGFRNSGHDFGNALCSNSNRSSVVSPSINSGKNWTIGKLIQRFTNGMSPSDYAGNRANFGFPRR